MNALEIIPFLLLFIRTIICTNTTTNPVKLTMKQGLLINQILSVYALDNAENDLCRNHTKRFKIGLRAFEPWALQMFDSSSKLQAGVLLGNLVDYGSFSQCLGIYKDTEQGPIYGKHCLLQLRLSKNLMRKILSYHNVSEKRFDKVYVSVEKSYPGWSVCVPHSCSREDILRHFNRTIMEMAEGLELSVSLNERHCNSALNQPVMGTSQYVVLSFLSVFIILGLTAALIDFQSDQENASLFVDTFSALKNMRRVMREGAGKKEMDFDFINGLRIFSSGSVVIGHRYIMYIMFPVINQLEELDWIVQFSSTLVLGSTITVDSFFMTSGMLVSIGFFEHVTKTGSFNPALFYLHRYLRITAPLAVVILFYVSTVQFLGSGPLQEYVYTNHQKPCQDYWWAALLHVQAYVNPTALCIYQNWYLSTDMAFYFFSPVVLYPLWRWPRFGYANIALLFVSATASSFYFAWVRGYNGEILPVTNQLFQTRYFSEYYIQPHTRAATYIIGLGFGYFVFHTKDRKIVVSKWWNMALWIGSLVVMATTVFSSGIFYLESHEYDKLATSCFLAFSRTAWTIGVVWIMWSCMHGYGGIVNDFLSAHVFRVLGRITYAIFLLHSIVQLYKNAAGKAPLTFSNMNVIYDAFADLFTVFIIAF
ncbi:hypothetical protein NQ315_011750, partial [Exocentrus adspersus]